MREDGATIEYRYDGLNRLVFEQKLSSASQEIYRREYGYDRVGNRLRRVRVDTSAEVVENLQYNGLGQLAILEWSDDGNRRFRYGYDRNGNLDWKQRQLELTAGAWVQEASWDFIWDREDRLVEVREYNSENVAVRSVEYRYCPTCSGALSQRIEYAPSPLVGEGGGEGEMVSWLRFEYEGLNLLRMDQKYDSNSDGLDEGDPWRVVNVYVHGPGQISQILRADWYAYSTPTDIPCDSGSYYYFYDTLGNVNGTLQDGNYYRWEIDAFGNDLPGGNEFLPMDQEGPKEHLTGRIRDHVTDYVYGGGRWLDTTTGRWISSDPSLRGRDYSYCHNNPLIFVDPDGLTPVPVPGPVPEGYVGFAYCTGSIWVTNNPSYFGLGGYKDCLDTCINSFGGIGIWIADVTAGGLALYLESVPVAAVLLGNELIKGIICLEECLCVDCIYWSIRTFPPPLTPGPPPGQPPGPTPGPPPNLPGPPSTPGIPSAGPPNDGGGCHCEFGPCPCP